MFSKEGALFRIEFRREGNDINGIQEKSGDMVGPKGDAEGIEGEVNERKRKRWKRHADHRVYCRGRGQSEISLR